MADNLDRLLALLAICAPGDDALELLDKARNVLDFIYYRAFLYRWTAHFYGGELAA